MRLFKPRTASAASRAPLTGVSAALDGAAAATHAERAGGATAALPGLGAAEHAADRWRGDAGGEAGEPPPPRCECGSEAAALAAAAGLAEAGLRATAFLTSGAFSANHDTLYGIAAKRLPLVLHMAAEAAPRAGWTALAGHDGYHAMADAGWFQLFAWDPQSVYDLALIARRLAEAALVPGVVAQDAWLTTHGTTAVWMPEGGQAPAFLGRPDDTVPSATPAQRLLYGDVRPRLPAVWSVDAPLLTGAAQGPGTAAEAVAARGPFLLAHVPELAAGVMAEYAALTGRSYAPVLGHGCEDADWLIVAQGSALPALQALADHLRAASKLRVGVANVAMLRPFPGALLAGLLQGRKGVLVLERMDAALADDAPLTAAVRVAGAKALENGRSRGEAPHPGYPRWQRSDELPSVLTATYGGDGEVLDTGAVLAGLERLMAGPGGPSRLSLGVAFSPRQAGTPKQELHAQQLSDAYPGLDALAPQPQAAPALLPQEACVVRCFSAAGREPFDDGSDPAGWLHDLAALHVSARPGAGRVRRGSPTHTTLVAARVPFAAGIEPAQADVVMAADAVGLADPALAGSLKSGGVLLVVPDGAETPPLPAPVQAQVQALGVRVWRSEARLLAREEARDPEAQARAAGRVLLGALLTAPPVTALTGLEDKALVRELKSVLLRRRPDAEAPDLDAELALYRAGTEALSPVDAAAEAEGGTIEAAPAAAGSGANGAGPASPELKQLPAHSVPVHDLHRHAEAHPQYRQAVRAEARVADPFTGSGALPPGTGLLRDTSALRAQAPHWLPENCTACGACWAICPDAALPALVNTPAEVLEAAGRVLEAQGHPTEVLPRLVRALDGKWRDRLAGGGDPLAALEAAAVEALPAARLTPDETEVGAQTLERLRAAVAPYALAVTGPFYTEPEGQARGSGGLLSITVDPERCKGCGACVRACGDNALEQVPQTPGLLATQRERWAFWLRLPTTAPAFTGLGEGRSTPPGPETLLLDKRVYRAMLGGTDTGPGAAEGTALHLLAAAAEAALRPAAEAHRARLDELIEKLEAHVRGRLAVDVSDLAALRRAMDAAGEGDLTLADLSRQVDRDGNPIDTAWLQRVTGTLEGLKRQRREYGEGDGGRPRAGLGMVVAMNGVTAPLATFPYNAFTFPASGQSVRAAAAAAEGLSEGHLARMAADFRVLRTAELELDGKYNPDVHDAFLAGFGWRDFSAEEWALCPPVVLVGDDAALTAEGAGAVLALLRSGRPVKVLCLDGHAHRALAAAPGRPPPFGEAPPGTGDALQPAGPAPAELALMGLAQGEAYVEQGGLGDVPRLLEGFLKGLRSPRPALFAVYRAELPGHGVGDALAAEQSRLALVSRAHPALRYDPDAGESLHERLSLAGNPDADAPFAAQAAAFGPDTEGDFTPADFALAVPSLSHHFTLLPDGAEDGLEPVADWLALDAEERRESRPVVWAADGTGGRRAWAVSAALAEAVAQRGRVWRLLRALSREDIVPVDEDGIARRAREDVSETVWRNLMTLAEDNGGLADALAAMGQSGAAAPQGGGDD